MLIKVAIMSGLVLGPGGIAQKVKQRPHPSSLLRECHSTGKGAIDSDPHIVSRSPGPKGCVNISPHMASASPLVLEEEVILTGRQSQRIFAICHPFLSILCDQDSDPGRGQRNGAFVQGHTGSKQLSEDLNKTRLTQAL